MQKEGFQKRFRREAVRKKINGTESIRRDKRLRNYFALVMIIPAVLSIMACEFVIWAADHYFPDLFHIDPLLGLGMLIPMGVLMEIFTFFLSGHLFEKEEKINNAIRSVADGDYTVKLDPEKLAPFSEVAADFNRMTDKLSSVETLRKDFTGNFSHEFKTPIVSINGFANLLLEENVTEEERKQYLQIIANESERLSELSKNTMLLSHLDTMTEIPNPKNYSLSDQIRQEIILLSKAWEEKNIQMNVDLEEAVFFGNRDIMAHVWINILNNAIKFTPDGGRIRVTLQKNGQAVQVTISDTGKGMTPEQAERIFERYYQADTSHSGNGLGLGLAITKRILELAGGTIGVKSSLGQGSTFTVTLPVKS